MLPLLKPIRALDGSVLSEVSMPKGTILLLHFTGCNTNKDLWGDDAEEWKPERWLGKLPQVVDDARIPGVYSSSCVSYFADISVCIDGGLTLNNLLFRMTFSGGGRACM